MIDLKLPWIAGAMFFFCISTAHDIWGANHDLSPQGAMIGEVKFPSGNSTWLGGKFDLVLFEWVNIEGRMYHDICMTRTICSACDVTTSKKTLEPIQ